MIRCIHCKVEFPDFMRRCPTCDETIPDSDKYKPLSAQIEFYASFQRPLGAVQTSMKRIHEDLHGGKLPTPDQANREIRQKLRIQCELFYEQYQQAIHPYYDRDQMERYVRLYLTDDVTPREFEDRARELVRMLNSYVRQVYEAEKRLREQEEDERRRLREAEQEQQWQRERVERERLNQLHEQQVQRLSDQSQQFRNEIRTHGQSSDKIAAILNNPHVDAETKLKAIRGLLGKEPGDELFDYNSLEAEDL